MEDIAASIAAVKEAKKRHGEDMLILVHHYQRRELVSIADKVGDSYALARAASKSKASRIVFCGVHFMAESACILANPEQRVFMPDPHAGCPMADMADPDDVERALLATEQVAPGRKVVPVVYVNSSAEVKAIAGRRGGICCTSSSAAPAIEWARTKGDLILFLPDRHLGFNTCRKMGLTPVARWNPHEINGGLSTSEMRVASVITWSGYCHVHTFFTRDHVEEARARYPGARVVVHPECQAEVVQAADESGSTSLIVDAVKNASPGETIVIGTEINLVTRLGQDYPWVNVVPLAHSLCPNMYRTTPAKLARLLAEFDERFEVRVDDPIRSDAKLALDRMLAVGG